MSPPPVRRLVAIQHTLAVLNRRFAQFIFIVAAGLLVFLSVTLFIQVISRYVIRQPLPWTEELARYALVWFAVLAAAAGAWSGQHFVFRWATLVLNERLRRALRLVVTGITLVIVGTIVVLSYRYIDVFRGQSAISVPLDMRIPFSGVPIGLSCFFVIYLLDLVDGLLALRTGVVLSERERRETSMDAEMPAGRTETPKAEPGNKLG
jgi:TRAP-type C4-dicarboxylate transport system permease small subunit